MLRDLRINERIRSREIRLIGAEGENRGVLAIDEALRMAREAGLDLVEVSPNANPPVCRILDYGKWKYEQAKKEREAKKHQRGTMIHEVRMRPRTGQHDIDLKVRIATRLLGEGDKVKLAVMFRGREMAHPEVGREVLDKALNGLADVALVEKPPGMEGRFLSVILTPAVKKPEKEAEESADADADPAEAVAEPAKAAKPKKAVAKRAKAAAEPEKAAAKPAKAAAEPAEAVAADSSSGEKSKEA